MWHQAVNRICVQLGASPLSGWGLLNVLLFWWCAQDASGGGIVGGACSMPWIASFLCV